MSVHWYPVINYELCAECGACVDKCKNGVYDKASTKPVVIYKEGCIDQCRGCQVLCPAGALNYYGDVGQPSANCCQSVPEAAIPSFAKK